MTKNDLINEVAYELNDFLSKEQIDRMKITLYVKMQDFELAEIKQLPMTMEHGICDRSKRMSSEISERGI